MSRWKAAGIHFSISLTVFFALLLVILQIWYPGILFTIDGGWQGLRLIIAVDLVAGPLLTLVIFKSGKPGLKFDLSCIAIFQTICMTAGVWVVYNERPLALVLAYDTIYSLNSQELQQNGHDPSILADFPGSYPKSIYIELPESDIAAEIASIRSQFIGQPLYVQVEDYRAMPQRDQEIREVFRADASTRRTLSAEALGQAHENCAFSKFISPVVSGIVCFDVETRMIEEFYETAAATNGSE